MDACISVLDWFFFTLIACFVFGKAKQERGLQLMKLMFERNRRLVLCFNTLCVRDGDTVLFFKYGFISLNFSCTRVRDVDQSRRHHPTLLALLRESIRHG